MQMQQYLPPSLPGSTHVYPRSSLEPLPPPAPLPASLFRAFNVGPSTACTALAQPQHSQVAWLGCQNIPCRTLTAGNEGHGLKLQEIWAGFRAFSSKTGP